MMTPEQLEGNRTIAEFMGVKCFISRTSTKTHLLPNGREHRERDLKYHKKWDWLIPVIEKLESMEDSFKCSIIAEKCKITFATNRNTYVHTEYGNTKIEATFNAAISFINFYKKYKSK